MKSKLESAYAKALTGAFKAISPIKRTIKKTECEVHLNIQQNALEILNHNDYNDEYNHDDMYTDMMQQQMQPMMSGMIPPNMMQMMMMQMMMCGQMQPMMPGMAPMMPYMMMPGMAPINMEEFDEEEM